MQLDGNLLIENTLYGIICHITFDWTMCVWNEYL